MNNDKNKVNLNNVKNIFDLPENVRPIKMTPSEYLQIMKKSCMEKGYNSIDEAAFDMVDEIICFSFSNGHLVRVNNTFKKILGYTPDEVIGVSVLKFIHPDDIESTINAQTHIFNSDKLNYFENRWKKKDGSWIRFEWSSSKIYDGYISIARIKNETDEYLSKITHELRTPLNSIVGFTSLLSMSENLSQEELSYIDNIKTSSNHLITIVNDILDLNKTSTVGYNLIRTNLKDFMLKILKQYKPLLKTLNLKLTFEYSVFDNYIDVDINKFTSVINNIVSNAIKFNKKQGDVKIWAELDKENNIKIFIRDTGIGMSKDFIKNIYTPFKREHSTIDGTGLGLSIVKNIMQLMNGKIEIESTKDEFTKVVLSVPICSDTPLNVKFDSSIKTWIESSNIIKIVYVEDNKFNALVINKYLEKIFDGKIEFKNPINSTEGFELLKKYTPDILLLDYHLPDHNGDYLFQKLIDHDVIRNIKYISMLSADSGIAKMDTMKRLGIKNYILKPVAFDDFESLMLEIKNKI